MKQLIAMTLFVFSGMLHAMNLSYDMPSYSFPNELSKQGLPIAFPCRTSGQGANYAVSCVWMAEVRTLRWIDNQGRNMQMQNHLIGKCDNGVCQAEGQQLGHLQGNIPWFKISPWYYVDSSIDGQPVAYLWDTGPGFGGERISYVEAGDLLMDFYTSSGMKPNYAKAEFNAHYTGGYDKYIADREAKYPATEPETVSDTPVSEVTEAWCNPQMDDECFVNSRRVPMADLGKYLPKVDFDDVMSNGGSCDMKICYSSQGKPIGLR
ncbi:hypothetical protein [Pseudomonas mosselii]|uniref:hypothetical protein n=1 Tax=Pseudomonas mosselii TaxID=78327 RepID=UPI0021D80894|nr:hypothetical protein [Pseudomonas mosselii]MCU9530456.1 hypothetical protein [Pseudomonas mosselii]MCU9537629.1 hypothetical protein [Pseudomonas mosselii]MCU9543584.1 hypothetical protein [Pseudomonas mosselii]MCU9549515.1 hypothetical protein [Pseudomonas mosselii]